jgi:hypothetical protein
MRISACLLVILCSASAGHTQGVLEWSAVRRLVKDDFKGRVPPAAPNASVSAISIETAWECKGGMLVASARALFDPSRSWWRSSQGSVWAGAGDRATSSEAAQQYARRSTLQRDLQLLEHEQLHFDIAEVTVRNIRTQFSSFANACAEPGGTEPITQMVARADRELLEEQQRYDRETGHGVNERAQDAWRQRIRALLK